jgi:hypothetical protein
MSQFDEEDENGNEELTFADLRKAYNKQVKENKALTTELSSFRKDVRKTALTSAIEAAGLNPKIAAFVPSDIDTNGIVEWLSEFGDVFAPTGASGIADQATTEQVPPPDGAQVFNQVANGGTPPNGDDGQLLARIQGAKTKEELDAIIFGT